MRKISRFAQDRATPSLLQNPEQLLWCGSDDLLPEGSVSSRQKRIFAGVPAEEMGRMRMLGVGFARLPDFVEQESAGRVRGAIQIITNAAVFFPSGRYHAAQFRFEDRFLAFAGAQLNDQRNSIFGELRVGARARAGSARTFLLAGTTGGRSFPFAF